MTTIEQPSKKGTYLGILICIVVLIVACYFIYKEIPTNRCDVIVTENFNVTQELFDNCCIRMDQVSAKCVFNDEQYWIGLTENNQLIFYKGTKVSDLQ